MSNANKIQSMGNMEMCPMASMCKGMATKPLSGSLLMIPGILLVLIGVLIIIEPRILVWLIASASILIGVMMLFFANFIRKMSAHFINSSG
jgi:hypothetical protein